MLSDTSSTAMKSPNFLVTFSIRTYGFASGSVQGSNFSWVARGEVAMVSLCCVVGGAPFEAALSVSFVPGLRAAGGGQRPVTKRVQVRLSARVYSADFARLGCSRAATSGVG